MGIKILAVGAIILGVTMIGITGISPIVPVVAGILLIIGGIGILAGF